ncbi:MAG TPA: erythromycin esterase family protein [Burkholderiales bacterium]|nr:erythromycin esterase family protein [Burkholderiales bacterium]
MLTTLRKSLALALAFVVSASALGALPGVTEFKGGPEALTDAQLSALLDTRVAAAQVVALGETVHGSAGLLQIQTRLIRYLVAHHGFRLIVWENPTLRSLELARWVASCTKARTPAPLAVLYMPTASDAALWDWVCEFNRSHANNPIVFRGMDIWDRPWEHYARIQSLGNRLGIDRALLSRIATSCPAHRAVSWDEIGIVLGKTNSDGKAFPDADYEACHGALTTLFNFARQVAAVKKKKNDSGADEAYELAISASTILGWLGFYRYNWSDDILSWNARDLAQGRNLDLVMEQHNASRAIVSAHTSHVSHARSAADWWGFGDIKSGISFFTALTGKKVFNIALTAYEASGAQGHWSLPTATNSLDKTLRDAGHTFSFFASNAAFLSKHPRWWIQNQNYPGPYESGVEIVPRDHFDAYFFLDRSHLDRALPARPMWEP